MIDKDMANPMRKRAKGSTKLDEIFFFFNSDISEKAVQLAF